MFEPQLSLQEIRLCSWAECRSGSWRSGPAIPLLLSAACRSSVSQFPHLHPGYNEIFSHCVAGRSQ